MQCLSILVFMEEDMEREAGKALLEKYIYFIKQGINSGASSIRAAAVAMLSVIVQFDQETIVSLFPALKELAVDSDWEVKAQVIIVLSNVVPRVANQEEPLTDIALSAFSLDSTIAVQKIGLAYVGRILEYLPRLADRYVEIMLRLVEAGESQVVRLLDASADPEDLPEISSSGGVYSLDPFPQTWSGFHIAASLVSHVKRNSLKMLERWHTSVLAAAIVNADELIGEWEAVFADVQKHVFVSMCDADTCKSAIQIVNAYALKSALGGSILETPAFMYTLKLLFSRVLGISQEADVCQTSVTAFLLMCISLEPGKGDLGSTAAEVMSEFCIKYPELLESSAQLRQLEKAAWQRQQTEGY